MMVEPQKDNRPGRRVPRSRDEIVACCVVPAAVLVSHIVAWFSVLSHDSLLSSSRLAAVFLALYWGLGVFVLWGHAVTALCTKTPASNTATRSAVHAYHLPLPVGAMYAKHTYLCAAIIALNVVAVFFDVTIIAFVCLSQFFSLFFHHVCDCAFVKGLGGV